ncbi:hypothetical protein AMAG_19593 [Allomyces macrogynus ATCC 38327]|uniref:RRM domain-containing protein n=1 Tax=Allomyces macrogynus (strain ATCC 38327) TaxID=578462 RepID=A0A0L0SW41_ALLM3|nr:hypothetical protein AMAG_19593 [Allomyces macrogynus ATCC 38327]|eukprot:KNE66549.1 hypothetical protein AMAG_19593 [Allomyces macrogynus ATCC 38327]
MSDRDSAQPSLQWRRDLTPPSASSSSAAPRDMPVATGFDKLLSDPADHRRSSPGDDPLDAPGRKEHHDHRDDRNDRDQHDHDRHNDAPAPPPPPPPTFPFSPAEPIDPCAVRLVNLPTDTTKALVDRILAPYGGCREFNVLSNHAGCTGVGYFLLNTPEDVQAILAKAQETRGFLRIGGRELLVKWAPLNWRALPIKTRAACGPRWARRTWRPWCLGGGVGVAAADPVGGAGSAAGAVGVGSAAGVTAGRRAAVGRSVAGMVAAAVVGTAALGRTEQRCTKVEQVPRGYVGADGGRDRFWVDRAAWVFAL